MSAEIETSLPDKGTYFHNGRKWYNAYVPSADNPSKVCLKNASPAYVLARDRPVVIDGVSKIVKSFTPFNDLMEMIGFVASNPNDSYYEYLQDNQSDRKLYFDIDHKVKKGTEGPWHEYHRRHLGALSQTLWKLFAEYNLPFDSSDVRIYHSCGVEGDWFKFSFHYVVVGYRTMSYKHHGYICKEVISRMAAHARDYNLCVDNVYPGFLDTAPYNCTQAFRLYGSCKSGSTRRKVLLNMSGKEKGYTLFAVDGSTIDCTRTGKASLIMPELESLILQPPLGDRSPLDGTFCPMPEDTRKHSSNTLEGQRMEAAFTRFLELHPQLKGVYEIGEGNKLTRNPGASAYCPKCQREHDGDNAYLNVSDSGSVNFYCCRAESSLPVSGITLKGEMTDEDEEDEDEQEVEVKPVAPPSKQGVAEMKENIRAQDCLRSRIAYRGKEDGGKVALDSKSGSKKVSLEAGMEDALTAFRAYIHFVDIDNYGRLVDAKRIEEEEGDKRPDSDAAAHITIVERLTEDVVKRIALTHKLYNGSIVLFRDLSKEVRDASIPFQWKKPSTGKIVKDSITVSELLSGCYITGAKYKEGSFPDTISAEIRSKILGEIEFRRNAMIRLHERCFTKVGNVCHIPYFRGMPAPLPTPTSVNVFTGFKADPYKFLLNAAGQYNGVRFTDFMRMDRLEAAYKLIRYGIAGGNDADFDIAMCHCSHPLLNLSNPRTGKAMVALGAQGTGKSTLGNMLIDIYGDLAIATNLERMMSKFNGILANRIFVMLDEAEPSHNADGTTSAAQKAQSRNYTSRFKEFVTGEKIVLENKFEKEKSTSMSMNFYLASNNYDVSVIEVTETHKDRRPIIFDSRTCCLRVNPDNTRFYYFYSTGESDKCVDENGRLLNPHPTPEEVVRDKDRFYTLVHQCRSDPDFTSLFAASLISFGWDHGTERILHYVQPADHPVVAKMRNSQVSNVTRFMDALCGDEFKCTEPMPFRPHARRDLKPHMKPIEEDGVTINPKCYFAATEELYAVFCKWFTSRNGRSYVPIFATFDKDLAVYASRNASKVSMCKDNGRVKINGVKTTGCCFITYTQNIPLHFGMGPDPASEIPQVPTPLVTKHENTPVVQTSDAPSPFPTKMPTFEPTSIISANKPVFTVPLIDDRYKKLEEENRALVERVKSQDAKLDQMMQMMQQMMQQRT